MHMDNTWESSCWPQFSHQLSKADFHGAHVKVTRAQCSSLVGKAGIVIFDSKNTFKIIGIDNIVRTIPKQPTVFSITVEDFTFTLFGKYFCSKPSDRSVKKIRNYMIADL
ncbi:Ribonuclease P protein subunit p29 [Blattella germanica]|nr:Ribonuclease P protein subunit p29 [Blattella germanica]